MSKIEYEDLEENEAQSTKDAPRTSDDRSIEAKLNVPMDIQILLGTSRMPVSQILSLGRGAVIELDKKIGEPVEVVVNDRVVARGDLVKVSGDRIGVTLTEIVREYVQE